MDRLNHKRYNDGLETKVKYTPPSWHHYLVRSFPDEKLMPIPVDAMKTSLGDKPELLQLLEQRLLQMESLISLDFDPSRLHVATIAHVKERHGKRYLDDVKPCYSYMTLDEFHRMRRPVRAGNGSEASLCLPLFLSEQHGKSVLNWVHDSISKLCSIRTCALGSSCHWHDLWIPDVLAHLMNQSILDFSRGAVSDPGVQFVIDCMRMLVFLAEAEILPHSQQSAEMPMRPPKRFPNIVPLMRTYLLNFVHHPEHRSRDKVPDLGDLLQWLSVMGLLDDSTQAWEADLVHAILVESMRRQARWVGKRLIEKFRPERQLVRPKGGYYETYQQGGRTRRQYAKGRFRRETESQMLVRCAKENLSPKELLGFWWETGQVGGRVLLYSRAFYSVLAQGKTLEEVKGKYDPVLGAAHPGDLAAIHRAKTEIEGVSDLRGLFARMGFGDRSDKDIYELCLWALEAREGYHCVDRADPLEGGWKAASTTGSRRKNRQRQGGDELSVGSGGSRSDASNPFAVLLEDREDRDDKAMPVWTDTEGRTWNLVDWP